MKKIYYILLIILSFYSLSLKAQIQDQERIFAIARNYGDSVVVRWATNSPALWLALNRAGYRLEWEKEEFLGIDKDSFPQYKYTYTPVRPEIFKPLPLEAMIERYKDEKHPMGMMATEFLYGDVDLRGEDYGFIGQITAEAEAQNMRFAYVLFCADIDPDVADAVGLRYSFSTKGITDSVITIRIVPLVDSNLIKVAPAYVTINTFEISKKAGAPSELFTETDDGAIRIHWKRDNRHTAYYVERSTDGKTFKPLHKLPFISSSAEEEELTSYYLPDSTFSDSVQYIPQKPMPLFKFNIYNDSVNNNVKYYYRVYGIDAFGDKSDYSEVVSNTAKEDVPLLPPSNVKAEILKGGRIKISWDEPEDKSKLKGYIVSHANNYGEDHFNVVGDTLFPPGTKECYHSNISEGINNVYIVSSIDYRGKYYKANPVSAYVNDSTPPSPPKGVKTIIDTSGLVLISWASNPEQDIKGYKVFSAYGRDIDYNQISNYTVEDTLFLDKVNVDFLNNRMYYKVIAVDKAGNYSEFSEPCEGIIPDLHPPTSPVVKSYLVRTDGVDIKFAVGNESDLKRFVVKRKVGAGDFNDHKTISLKQVKNYEVYFSDTISSKGYFEYALLAEDLEGLRSGLSQAIPVTINSLESEKPVIKIDANYSLRENAVIIKWKRPKNIAAKKYHYVIFRQVEGGNWEMFDTVGMDTLEYSDKKVLRGKQYKYKVVPYSNGSSIGNGDEFTVNVR